MGLSNYAGVFSGDPGFRNAVLVTCYFTGLSVAIEIGLGVGLAQFLNREFVGKGVGRTLFILPMAGTPVALALVWRHMYNPSSGLFTWLAALLGLPAQRWLVDATTVLPSLILFDVWHRPGSMAAPDGGSSSGSSSRSSRLDWCPRESWP